MAHDPVFGREGMMMPEQRVELERFVELQERLRCGEIPPMRSEDRWDSERRELVEKAHALQVGELLAEVDRLRRGDFTPDELQSLCHNMSEEDYVAFCDGCDQYQRKLFGQCRSDERVAERAIAELNERIRRVENQNPWIGGSDDA